MSCSQEEVNKEKNIENYKEENIIDNLSSRTFTGYQVIIVPGKQNHRLRNSCNRRMSGVCRMHVPILQNEIMDPSDLLELGLEGGVISPVLTDDHGNDYIEIPVLDEDVIFEDDEKNLFIDEDIFSEGNLDLAFKLNAGIYPIDMEIGEHGGHKVLIERL